MTDQMNLNTRSSLQKFSVIAIYASIVLIFIWFGGMKFTAYEATGLKGFVEPSFVIGWMYGLFSVRGFGNFLGVVELLIAALIAARLFAPKLSFIGGLLSCGLFLTTLSFMLTTKGVFGPDTLGFPALSVMPGQFLIKDIVNLAVSVFIVGESLSAMRQKSAMGLKA